MDSLISKYIECSTRPSCYYLQSTWSWICLSWTLVSLPVWSGLCDDSWTFCGCKAIAVGHRVTVVICCLTLSGLRVGSVSKSCLCSSVPRYNPLDSQGLLGEAGVQWPVSPREWTLASKRRRRITSWAFCLLPFYALKPCLIWLCTLRFCFPSFLTHFHAPFSLAS